MISKVKELRDYIENSNQEWNIAVLDEPTVGWEVISSQLDYCHHNPGYTIDRLIPDRIWVVWCTGVMREILIDERTTKEELEKCMPELKKNIDDAERYWSELQEAQQNSYWEEYDKIHQEDCE